MMAFAGFVLTITFIGSISCAPILRSSLHVMTIRIWKVSCSDMTLGIPFYSHLMRNGGAVSVVATWRIPSGGYLCVV